MADESKGETPDTSPSAGKARGAISTSAFQSGAFQKGAFQTTSPDPTIGYANEGYVEADYADEGGFVGGVEMDGLVQVAEPPLQAAINVTGFVAKAEFVAEVIPRAAKKKRKRPSSVLETAHRDQTNQADLASLVRRLEAQIAALRYIEEFEPLLREWKRRELAAQRRNHNRPPELLPDANEYSAVKTAKILGNIKTEVKSDKPRQQRLKQLLYALGAIITCAGVLTKPFYDAYTAKFVENNYDLITQKLQEIYGHVSVYVDLLN